MFLPQEKRLWRYRIYSFTEYREHAARKNLLVKIFFLTKIRRFVYFGSKFLQNENKDEPNSLRRT